MFKQSLHFQDFVPIIVTTSSSHHKDPEVIYNPHLTNICISNSITKLPKEKAVMNKQYGVGKYLIAGLKSLMGCRGCCIFCKNFIDDLLKIAAGRSPILEIRNRRFLEDNSVIYS
jgi:hypothetical protein